jgi:hypothetical protein
MPALIERLSRGFRERYLSYDEIVEQLRAWAREAPDVVELRSIGQSREGRELWVIVIGREPGRARPSVWVDGNMHAGELCGSSVALSIAEDMLALHLAPEQALHGLPAHVRQTLVDVPFYVMPRLSPDGAEAVLMTGRSVRSVPRDERGGSAPRWVAQDLDGDGLALSMRIPHPAGEFVEARERPGVLVPRELEDEGPFYKLYPEGVIEDFDGFGVPDPHYLSDNFPDLNRNFPWSWAPEPDQLGAGAFPTSEPESRAVVELTSKMPELFAWLNLHTFGGVFIRPLGNAPDSKMDPSDLALFRQIASWGEALTGYPTVSGFEEFLYEPDKPLHGDLSDYAYHQRGAIAYVCELWDLFRKLDMKRPAKFVDHYLRATREDLLRLARWDAEENESRVYRPWRRVVHPQLGEVEVGGFDPRFGITNPPFERLAGVCVAQSAAFLRVAALAPRIVVGEPRATRVGEGVHRIELSVENHGYLPSYVLASSRALPWNEPLRYELELEGPTLVSGEPRRTLGHLEGWGRGQFGSGAWVHLPRSRGSSGSCRVSFVTSGRGRVTVRVAAPRIGKIARVVQID